MADYGDFRESIDNAASSFRSLIPKGPIRIISHLDSDGISAASILIRAFENEGLRYEISIIQQVSDEFLDKLSLEGHDTVFFTDLGSAKTKEISEKLPGRKIFILDHHEIKENHSSEDIIHINPHLFGIEGGREISGAGVVFLFARALNRKNDEMAHIAIIGAIGDVQESKGFIGLNDEILKIAEERGLIKISQGLRSFGKTRQLHKMLEYSSDPYIPGVTGNESGAWQLLLDAGIDVSDGNGGFRRYIDLSEDERKSLSSAVILRRMGERSPEDIFGFNYLIDAETIPNLRDAKEFSTLLNASGRLDNASLGIGVCLGDEAMKRKAIANLSDYKKEIVAGLKWFNENKGKSDDIFLGEGFMILNAKDRVRSTIAGTLASIISKSNDYASGTFVLSMAYAEDGIKTSLRVVGESGFDLREIMQDIVGGLSGETGGHKNAAGAIVPKGKETEIIALAKKALAKNSSGIDTLSDGKTDALRKA